MIFLVPAALILITASTRYLRMPRRVETSWVPTPMRGQLHRRSPNPEPQAPSSAVVTPTSSGTSAAPSSSSSGSVSTQPLPTIPSTPPPLPTPFPQPFDTTLSQNFSTVNCQNFFQNITQAESFRECRPFSLLQQSSSSFIEQAQTNITELNVILWGTCNTDPSVDACTSTMQSFISSLQSSCSSDLANKNAMVVSLLNGLQSYALLRNAACLPDPSTNTYCYIEAVHNTNPSDLFFYQLPLGKGLPSDITPSCSACTKSVMGLFSQAQNLTALSSTYGPAAKIAVSQCGQGYVETTGSSSSASNIQPLFVGWLVLALSIFMMW